MRPALDWSRPWLAPLRPWGERLPLGVDTAAALDAMGSGAARFVAASELPTGEAYEVFGHALLEQLARAPRKGLTAHVVVGDPLQWTGETWACKPFLPLPVLGVPGWWPANEDPHFYEDSSVFRPARP